MTHTTHLGTDLTDWKATGWYRVTDDKGKIWAETSSESEARREASREGYTLEEFYERTESMLVNLEQSNKGYWTIIRKAWDEEVKADMANDEA